MKKPVRGEIVFVLVFAVLAVLVSLSQTFVYILETPTDFVYPLVHNYVEDYYYYLHVMRQGFDGMWLATSRLSPENYPPQFVNPFFITLGHLARSFYVSLPFMYTVARAIGSFGIVLVTYILVRRIFPDSLLKRIIAMTVIFTSSFFWYWGDGRPKVAPLVHEWTEFDPVFRLSYIPHHLWSKVLMIVIFLCMLSGLHSRNKRWIYLSSLLTVAMGFISPVVLATFVPIILLWFAFEIISKIKKSSIRFELTLVGAVFLSSLGVAIYHRMVQYSVPPWTSYIWWEKVQYFVTLETYVQTFGLNLLLFLFAVPEVIKMRSVGKLLMVWFLTGFITLFIFAPLIPLTNSRYMGGYQFIPVGIGATITILALSSLISKRFPKLSHITLPVILSIVLIYNCLGIYASWREHRDYINKNKWNIQVYVPQDIWQFLQFLNEKNNGSIVVAPLELNPFIPAFSNSKTISGHKTITLNYDQKNQELANFYSIGNERWSKDFLTRYNAKYIVDYSYRNADAWYAMFGFSIVYNTPSIRIYERL